MQVEKKDNIITIVLSQEENSAMDYFIHKRGKQVLDEYFGFFFQSRIETKKVEERDELYRSMSESERNEFLKRLSNG